MDEYILVGKTRKTYGIKGGIKLHVEEQFVEDVLQVEVAFLKIHGKFLPFFIQNFDYTNSLIVHFEDLNTPEDAHSYTSKEFYIRKKDVHEKVSMAAPEGALTYSKLKGFQIQDETLGVLGEILDVHDFPQQEMAEINYNNKEIFIPLNDQLITAVDEKSKTVMMDLPEGLMEL